MQDLGPVDDDLADEAVQNGALLTLWRSHDQLSQRTKTSSTSVQQAPCNVSERERQHLTAHPPGGLVAVLRP